MCVCVCVRVSLVEVLSMSEGKPHYIHSETAG